MADNRIDKALPNITPDETLPKEEIVEEVDIAEELGKKPIDDEVRKKTREISKSRSEIARGYDIPEKVFHSPDSTAYHKAKAGAAKWDAIGSIASSFFS